MKTLVLTASLALAAAFPLIANAQAPQGKAESWGLQNEKLAVISGEVVDVACHLTGDCPAQCGAGQRQLGILQADGKLALVSKNGQPIFTGAIEELLPYCKKKIDADGLFSGNDKATMFQIQFLREAGSADWKPADRWTQVWSARNPALADKAEEWFYHDPRIQKQIDANGYLGLGKAADVEFIKKQ
jgi:hypothetical protein